MYGSSEVPQHDRNGISERANSSHGRNGPERSCPQDQGSSRRTQLVLPSHRTRTASSRRRIPPAPGESPRESSIARKGAAPRTPGTPGARAGKRNAGIARGFFPGTAANKPSGGHNYLCDEFAVSYAPSATVFSLCQRKPEWVNPRSLVFGIADERAPQILEEVQSVAALLPGSSLYLGDAATSSLLREKGLKSGVLHIATHGIYRQDNPMFSSIRLGDGYLNLYDLYQMRLHANLVTLSGCATGMNVIAAGDELLGLQRGLFCAGATTLLLSLWDVHDQTTAELMRHFYQDYVLNGDIAHSLQNAMRAIRQQAPHPYYWAPFVIVGKLSDSKRLN